MATYWPMRRNRVLKYDKSLRSGAADGVFEIARTAKPGQAIILTGPRRLDIAAATAAAEYQYSDRDVAAFAGADTRDGLDGGNPDLAVADRPRPGVLGD